MDLFGLIVSYLYHYIFIPMYGAFEEFADSSNPLSGFFLISEGKISFVQYFEDSNGNVSNLLPVYDNNGNYVYGCQAFTVVDVLCWITTVFIFILLFIVAVKFIVWLFKQISFITRF